MQDEKFYVTQEGLEKLQEEYKHLNEVVNPEVIEELKAARAQGDLSENADYDAARDKQAQVTARIADLEVMLKNIVLIEDEKGSGKSKTVRLGSTVTIEALDTKEKETFTIVGSVEADPLKGKVSNETPVAKAILEQKVGAEVQVESAKPYKVRIVSVK